MRLHRKLIRIFFITTCSCLFLLLMLATSAKQRINTSLPISWSAPARLGDVYFSVKTSRIYHHTRVPVILDTWVAPVANQTYFFTDAPDVRLDRRILDGHFINTRCPGSHEKFDLCCKMAAEFSYYLSTSYLWFCHVDDDMYINLVNLVDWLQQYDVSQRWYLGKLSWKKRFKIESLRFLYAGVWFATGALVCISRPLALEMKPYMVNGMFVKHCKKTNLPDDIGLAYIIEILVGVVVTPTDEIHSHLEGLANLTVPELQRAITVSYANPTKDHPEYNRINITGLSAAEDKTRFYSYHCWIYNQTACTRTIPANLPPRILGKLHEPQQ